VTTVDIAPVSDDALWQGLQTHVRDTMGIVGIPKMLAVQGEDAARVAWTARVRPVLSALAAHVPVTERGPALVGVGDGVQLQFGIHDVVISVEDAPRWRCMILVAPAAVALAAVGRRRWGRAWVEALEAHPTSRPIRPRETAHDAGEFPWVAQNPGGPAPYTVAVTEDDARLAAHAEELGVQRVSSLFEEFKEARL